MDFQNVPISKIKPNPLNPRQIFEGPAFDELVESIRANGVIEPIIVRPKKKGFELVAGERRFRAFSQIASENGNANEIPAIVRELSDDQAFDVMTIENLHRESLSEAEEAKSFKQYVDKKGDGAIEALAERAGLSPRYIRRRVAVMELPKKILKDWEKGKIAYGVLEQLLRLDPSEIEEFYDKYSQWTHIAVDQIKGRIDNRALSLKHAQFSLKKAGCDSCNRNTQVQCSIFGDDFMEDGAHCMNTSCFIEHQRTHLTENWKKTQYYKKNKTNGFRFSDEVKWNEVEYLWNTFPDCTGCESLITILTYEGRADREKACANPPCLKSKQKASRSSGSSGSSSSKPDHGTIFREAFYTQRIPQITQTLDIDDERLLRLTLSTVVHANHNAKDWFGKTVMKRKEMYWISTSSMVDRILTMNRQELKEAIRDASLQVALQSDFGAESRHRLGSHFGIDLSRDWLLHEEYLNKKTIKEILAFGDVLGIFADQKAVEYLTSVLGRKSVNQCKKKELVDLILKSGVDLAGRVPEEIKNVPEKKAAEIEEEELEEDETEENAGGEEV